MGVTNLDDSLVTVNHYQRERPNDRENSTILTTKASPMEGTAADIDAILSSFGICRGFYPVGIYLTYLPIVAFWSWQMFILSFAAWEPETRCAMNVSLEERNCTFSLEDCAKKGENCSLEFDAKPEESLVVEWNLVSITVL